MTDENTAQAEEDMRAFEELTIRLRELEPDIEAQREAAVLWAQRYKTQPEK